jgi:hypothetical protein
MWGQLLLVRRGFGGADVYVAVNLAAVGVDYFPVQFLGEFDAQISLA